MKDPSPFDVHINDIPTDGLHKDVSFSLNIPYLSRYEGNIQDISRKLKYSGVIIGDHSRFFVSIPTAKKDSDEYYYVHYLLDTGSPITTLTHEALCCLHDKKVDAVNSIFPSKLSTSIGGLIVSTYLSDPGPSNVSTNNYHNVNLLGMNFLRRFKKTRLEMDWKNEAALMELID